MRSPQITHKEHRGYNIIEIHGDIESGALYRQEKGGASFLSYFRGYAESLGKARPIALDVNDCIFRGSDSMGLFVEAHDFMDDRIRVVCGDEHTLRIIRMTGISGFLDIYRTVEDLPAISSPQARSGRGAPRAGSADCSPRSS